MKKRAVIVTGLCRAGGSAVAEICHVLGYAMGVSFMAPIAPDFRSDFEDAELTLAMARNVEDGYEPLHGIRLRGEIQRRLDHASAYGFHGIGFKSPLLSIGSALDELKTALGSPGRLVVRVERPSGDIEASIARQRGAAVLRHWNQQIERSGPTGAHLVISYRALVADPEPQVRVLAAALGLSDPERIRQATARVVKPCSAIPCP